MIVLLPANKATFSLLPSFISLLFTGERSSVGFLSSLCQDGKYAACRDVPVCLQTPGKAFRLLCDCCISCHHSSVREGLCVGGRERRGREAKKIGRRKKIWLAKHREISFAQQIQSAARYKLSGCAQAGACVWALMSVVMSVRSWDRAAAYVLAYK